MIYLKLYEEFSGFYTEKIMSDIKETARQNNVEIIFENTLTIDYPVGNLPVSGYFVDYGGAKLGVAMGKPVEDWIMVLLHESSHMDQWIEKSSYWTNSFINGRESVDYIDEWCSGKEFSEEQLDDFIKRSQDIEWDCEKRTIRKANKYNLPINEKEEIQKANSYILFYKMLKFTRKWSLPGKAPYSVKEVWSLMPENFDMDYNNIPENIKEAYLKYCF